jgi:hypothetical protein
VDEKVGSAFEEFVAQGQAKADQQQAGERPRSHTLEEYSMSHVPADFLINGLLRRGWLYGCTAPGGTGKTALAVLLTILVAQKQRPAFFGPHEVEQGKVAYFAGENPDDLRERFIALLDTSPDITIPNNTVRIFPTLFHPAKVYDGIVTEVEKMGGADLLFVDTSAAYFTKSGGTENENDDAGPWARVLRSLTGLPGKPTVVALCHPTKYATEPALLMPRGGSAFFLELDGNLTMFKDRASGLITLGQNRLRGVEFDPITLRTELIRSPKVKTAKGHIMPTISIVVVSEQDADMAEKAGRSNNNNLLSVMFEHPKSSPSEWATLCGCSRATVYRWLEALKAQRFAKKRGNDWELTRDGMAAAKEVIDASQAARQAQRQF